MKKLLLLIIAVLVIWGVWKWADNGKPAETANAGTYKVGVMVPLTGDAAVYGEPGRNIIQLAADEINKAGGVNGKELELIFEDGKCNGKDATSAAQKLVNVDKVEVIIGGFCSSESLAAIPVAAAAKVALLSPGSSSPALTNASPYFFRNYPSDAAQGQAIADAANKKGWKKIALIQEQTDYSVGLNKSFTESFTALGGTVIKEEFPTSTTDFRSILSKLKASNSDGLFIVVQTPASAAKIFKNLGDLNWKPALLVADIIPGDPTTVATYKNVLEGAIGAEFGVDPSNPKYKHLVDAYKAKYNVEPPFQSYAQTEYDSVYMVKDAIAAVGYDGEKIAQWSRTVKNWEGASGKITIQASGDRAGGHRAEVIKNGKVEVLAQ